LSLKPASTRNGRQKCRLIPLFGLGWVPVSHASRASPESTLNARLPGGMTVQAIEHLRPSSHEPRPASGRRPPHPGTGLMFWRWATGSHLSCFTTTSGGSLVRNHRATGSRWLKGGLQLSAPQSNRVHATSPWHTSEAFYTSRALALIARAPAIWTRKKQRWQHGEKIPILHRAVATARSRSSRASRPANHTKLDC